ncbi:MAG: hypothetical protein K9J21_07480, partial [Bacteroidales bacterium]|nr:hypothetical protein [Bacteroidales bacterium]
MKTKCIILILLIFLLCFSSRTIAQYGHADNLVLQTGSMKPANNYFFSFDSLGISKDTTIKTTGSTNHGTGTNLFQMAVFSDQNGNLKLYSDGIRAWNGQHQPIDTTLYPPDSVATSENVAVPMPDSSGLIYVFSLVHQQIGGTSLNYLLIDLNGNNGQGSVVVSGQQFTPYELKNGLALTKHANGRDYWLVSKKCKTNEYVSFRIKPSGNVDTVFSQAGLVQNDHSGVGYLKFSPNGKWLGDNKLEFQIDNDTLQLLNFDAATGMVSDSNIRYVPCHIPFDGIGKPIEYAFSPDSRYVYVFHHHTYAKRFNQYDLAAQDQQSFFNSRTMLRKYVHPQGYGNFGIMGLMANGKIYNPSTAHYVYSNNSGSYFNSIESPDSAGTASNWQDYSYIIDSTLYGPEYSHFPLFCSSWLQEPVDFSYTHTCAGENAQPTLFAFTDSVYEAEWHFGDS